MLLVMVLNDGIFLVVEEMVSPNPVLNVLNHINWLFWNG